MTSWLKESFNTPLEMPDRSKRRMRQPPHYAFQYSIGDAEMSFTVWICMSYPTFNTPLEMQQGAREAVAAVLVPLSILHWRCGSARIKYASHDVGAKLSILHWRCMRSPLGLQAFDVLEPFQYSIGYAPLLLPLLRHMYIRLSILRWRCGIITSRYAMPTRHFNTPLEMLETMSAASASFFTV